MYIINRKLQKKNQSKLIIPKNKIKESLPINGLFKIYSIKDGIKQLIEEKHNLITDDTHERTAKAFIGESLAYYYEIKYCAVGTDDTTPASDDETLGAEIFRTPYVVRESLEPTYPEKIMVTFYISSSEANDDIEEIGIFAGQSATSTTDSGNLLSHVLWSHTKSASEELLIEYQLSIGNAA